MSTDKIKKEIVETYWKIEKEREFGNLMDETDWQKFEGGELIEINPNEWFAETLAQAYQRGKEETLREAIRVVEGMNNFRQAKVDGSDVWNNALEQSAAKVDALVATLTAQLKGEKDV